MEISQSSSTKKLQSQLFFWTGEDAESISKQLCFLENTLQKDNNLSLHNLARALYLENSKKQKQDKFSALSIVSDSLDDFKKKLTTAKDLLKENPEFIRDAKGIYFSSNPLAKGGKIAFLFSGQGSQRPNMFKELTAIFPQMQESITKVDTVLKNRFPKLLSGYIFPPPFTTPEEEQSQMIELTRTNIAQPALGAIEVGLLKIMKLFGINADMLAGHSLGEYVALYAGGVFEEEMLYELLEYRGSAIVNSSKDGNLGGMLAVGAGAEDIKVLIKDISGVYPVRNRSPLGDRTEMPEALPISNGVYIANLNSPKQTILSGSDKSLDLASIKLEEIGFRSKKINVNCAFHSPYMIPAKDLLFQKLSTLDYKSPIVPVYSNLTAVQYPQNKESPPAPDACLPFGCGQEGGRAGILSILSEHLVSSVRFTEEIENMFKDGARVFIEIGPGNVLTNLVKQILGEGDYVAIASNIKTATDISQLLNVFAQLIAEGFKVNLSLVFEGDTTWQTDE